MSFDSFQMPWRAPFSWFSAALGLVLGLHLSAGETSTNTTLMVVVGAPGEESFTTNFVRQAQLWQSSAHEAHAAFHLVGLESKPPTNDLALLQQQLQSEPKLGTDAVWLILIGHGTFDGQEARFNLRGPDLSAAQLATWLEPFRRPLVIIDTASSSAPFIHLLSATNRVIITATRSGNELNFTRFGQYLAESVTNSAADLDHDGQISLLEVFLSAAARVREFYQTENRLITEHALIDDNGDGKGTPADWFRGTRVVQKGKEEAKPDGAFASRLFLKADPTESSWPPDSKAQRDRLESDLAELREQKPQLSESEYLKKLEGILTELAALYEKQGTNSVSPNVK